MTRDPEKWAVLGRAIRDDRDRRHLTREQLADLVEQRGGKVTPRSIANLEYGVVPKRRDKPPSLELAVAALGWRPGWADRILAGEDPAVVLDSGPDVAGVDSEGRRFLAEAKRSAPDRSDILEALPVVYQFGRDVVALGGDPRARDAYERAVQDLLGSLPSGAGGGRSERRYALAAYRPHAEGEGPAADDAARILDAMDED
ncbi:hypothetical protein [Streptomyces sp. XD-27]|uniref:hypothetical protein n=1 Tax=Streptomyces sp. XD-27 TaxID=3062779 RepID=UPI0026F412F2|nr:hypothetical protein [Streptomyces sp. XD-27]WKX70022.1 hypothetical protein Q3Y56_08960 [Streptomyces sp. XD-27]